MNGGSGGGAGQGASGGSIASIGLQTYATLLKSQGEAAGYDYQAQRLDVAAQYGDLKAEQTGGQMTRNLASTLSSIDAVRAAAGADPSSPTGAAVRNQQESIGIDQKNIAVDSIKAQSEQERSDAAYYRTASSNALLSGKVSAAAGVFSGISKMTSFGLTG